MDKDKLIQQLTEQNKLLRKECRTAEAFIDLAVKKIVAIVGREEPLEKKEEKAWEAWQAARKARIATEPPF